LLRHFERLGQKVTVQAGHRAYHRVAYALPDPAPRVSAVICTRDRHDLLRVVVEGLLKETDYPDIEILVVDNQSSDPQTLAYFDTLRQDPRIRIIAYDHPFNYAAMNNLAARQANGQVILFLNNDLKVIHGDWLREMVSQAVRPEIGAVGAKLYYEDGRIQHAGVTLGINGGAGHSFRLLKPGVFPGHGDRTHVVCSYSAVTGACMAIRKETFDRVGGFNEKDLAISFNDVDLCIRVGLLGLRNLFTPFAELYHFESVSRGPDNTDRTMFRFMSEHAYLWTKWQEVLRNDPYYNPNLTVIIDDFRYSTAPRASKPWKT
jgi:GT2 family glycosyltransferase